MYLIARSLTSGMGRRLRGSAGSGATYRMASKNTTLVYG